MPCDEKQKGNVAGGFAGIRSVAAPYGHSGSFGQLPYIGGKGGVDVSAQRVIDVAWFIRKLQGIADHFRLVHDVHVQRDDKM